MGGASAQYCINCILQWATYHADAPRCPQCKSHFHYIFTYKNLDGTMNDYLQEESVTLLMRARWFNVCARLSVALLSHHHHAARGDGWLSLVWFHCRARRQRKTRMSRWTTTMTTTLKRRTYALVPQLSSALVSVSRGGVHQPTY